MPEEKLIGYNVVTFWIPQYDRHTSLKLLFFPKENDSPLNSLPLDGGGLGPAPRRVQDKALNLIWFGGGGDVI